jgi:hypothetical protein
MSKASKISDSDVIYATIYNDEVNSIERAASMIETSRNIDMNNYKKLLALKQYH